MTSTDDTFDMSDDVFEESDIEPTKSQNYGKKALNVDELNDERTASPTGYPGYKPPKEALRMYALENDYFQENNERKNDPDDDIDGWKSYKIEDNDFDESIVHKTILLGDSGVGKTSFLVQYNTGEFRAGSFSATVGIALTVMLLGDSGVGKTCLLVRFRDGTFLSGNFISTVGIDFRLNEMKCFKCPIDFDNVDTFFSHVQKKHGIKGKTKCTCTLCFTLFGDFNVYKRHVETCSKRGMVTNEDLYNILIGRHFNVDLDNFNDSLKENALRLTLKLCSKPNFPRSAAFEIINEFKLFINGITTGLKTVILPETENSSLLEDFISTVDTSFARMHSESSLTTLLGDMNLTKPLIKIDVALKKRIDADDDDDEEEEDVEKNVEEDVAENAEENTDESDDDGAAQVVIEKSKCTLTIMPLSFQIKQFFELPNVFAKIQSHTAAIMAQPSLNHFIKGSVWRSKISNFADGTTVIPFSFYGDGVQTNNALGPHIKTGLQNYDYISFPTIPIEYQSRLNNIMVAAAFQEETIKKHGTKAVYGHIIRELAPLAQNGIDLVINNQPLKVYFVMGIFEGDNKECNRSLDFPDSHNAIHCCRFCRMDIEDMKQETEEKIELLRTEENYLEDVETNEMKLTGVKDWSVFNAVPYFHVVKGTVNDLPHDLMEGALPYSYKCILFSLFKAGYFTMEELNERIKKFNYGPDDCANKPPPISKKNIKNKKKKKVKMNFAEMFNFSHNITFLIGDLIPEEGGEDGEVDRVWRFVKDIVKMVDLCYLPWYEEEDLQKMKRAIKYVLEDYQELCEHLKPVFHYLTHYPTNTKKYGPLRYVQTLRKEGKHKMLKMYTKNTNNRLNLSLSVAKKMQYSTALRAHSSEGLEDIITTTKLSKSNIKDKPYFRNIRASQHKNTVMSRECNFTSKAVVNGVTFTKNSWLPDFTDNNKPMIYKVGDIVVMDKTDIGSIYLICKVYEKIYYEEHFVAYAVNLGSVQSHLQVVNLKEYLGQHQYPVLTHCINNKTLFRVKRF